MGTRANPTRATKPPRALPRDLYHPTKGFRDRTGEWLPAGRLIRALMLRADK